MNTGPPSSQRHRNKTIFYTFSKGWLESVALISKIDRITVSDTKEIITIDYSNCKEQQMINLLHHLKELVLSSDKPVSVVTIFNANSYATPAFMREIEATVRETNHLLKNEVVVGLSDTKKMILKGYNFLFNKNVQAFDTVEAAMRYLLDET